jgi:hypothetical protein
VIGFFLPRAPLPQYSGSSPFLAGGIGLGLKNENVRLWHKADITCSVSCQQLKWRDVKFFDDLAPLVSIGTGQFREFIRARFCYLHSDVGHLFLHVG